MLAIHTGDLLFPTLLSQRYDGQPMMDRLNRQDNAITPRKGAEHIDRFDPRRGQRGPHIIGWNRKFARDCGRRRQKPALRRRCRVASVISLQQNPVRCPPDSPALVPVDRRPYLPPDMPAVKHNWMLLSL